MEYSYTKLYELVYKFTWSYLCNGLKFKLSKINIEELNIEMKYTINLIPSVTQMQF